MDLTIPIIASVALLGYNLNVGPKLTRFTQSRQEVSANQIPSGKNIYENTYSQDVDNKVRQLGIDSYNKARNPMETNIIPPYFNSNSNSTSPIYNSSVFNGNGATLSEEQVSSFDKFQVDTGISELSGLPRDNTHSNMLPFFGGKLKANVKDHGFGSRESFTGNLGFARGKAKQEVNNPITPTPQNVFGSPSLSNAAIKERYTASQRQNNVLPFQQIRGEAPIPSRDNQGHHKTVDELRTANNPKTSYPGRITAPPKKELQRGLVGKLNKNKPDTAFESGPNRWNGPTAGYIHKPTMKENYTPSQFTTRGGEETLNLGIVKVSNPQGPIPVSSTESAGLITKVRKPHKIGAHKSKDFGRNNASLIEKRDFDLEASTYFVPTQERESTSQLPFATPSNTNLSEYLAPDQPLRTTLKETNLFGYTPNPENRISGPQSTLQYENMEVKNNRQELSDYFSSGLFGSNPIGADNINIRDKQENEDIERLDPSLLNSFRQNPLAIQIN